MAHKSARITMTEGPLLGILLRVAVPITLTNLVQSSYDLVNAFWLGRLGQSAIAAVAASGPIFYVLISLGSGLATAGAVLIAQNAGARRHDALDHVAAQTLLMVGAMALGFTIVGLVMGRVLLHAIGVTQVLSQRALERDERARRTRRFVEPLLVRAVGRPLDQAEVLDVARQGRLSRLKAVAAKAPAELLLAVDRFAADDVENRRLTCRLHKYSAKDEYA